MFNYLTDIAQALGNGHTIRLDLRGDRMVETTLIPEYKRSLRIVADFRFNRGLIDAIKTQMEDRRYHGFIDGDRRKVWSFPLTLRNIFRLEVLRGSNPYAGWDDALKKAELLYPQVREHMQRRGIKEIYEHQVQMLAVALVTGCLLWAADMGLGKTLAAILFIELQKIVGPVWWFTPNNFVKVNTLREFDKWKPNFTPHVKLFSEARKAEEKHDPNETPQIIICDEVSRLKSFKAQQSQGVKYVADLARQAWGDDFRIVELSGKPAPNTPVDWWMPVEIAAPGFLTEGHPLELTKRLAYFTDAEANGNTFMKILGWKDGLLRCRECGELQIDHQKKHHDFKGSNENEVLKLEQRLKGLVWVWKKEDCLDLPAFRFREIEVRPTPTILNLAKTILQSDASAQDIRIMLQCLSDGFVYKQSKVDEITCTSCNGKGLVSDFVAKGAERRALSQFELDNRVLVEYDHESGAYNEQPIEIIQIEVKCRNCDGSGKSPVFERTESEIGSPKDDSLDGLLEENYETGRLSVFCAYTGTINRVVSRIQKQGWITIRADGRGWQAADMSGNVMTTVGEDCLRMFSNKVDYPRLSLVGHPGSVGLGMTLVESLMTVFYSNTDVPDHRTQAMHRGHRIGMDKERGGWIVDLLHLPSDYLILNRLKNKERISDITLDALKECFLEKSQ